MRLKVRRVAVLLLLLVSLTSAAAILLSAFRLGYGEMRVGDTIIGFSAPLGALSLGYFRAQNVGDGGRFGWYEYRGGSTYRRRLVASLTTTAHQLLIGRNRVLIEFPLWMITVLSGAWPAVAALQPHRMQKSVGFPVDGVSSADVPPVR